jgi:hypothetical protein
MSHGSMVLTYQQLSLGHSIVSRRDRSCEKCAVSYDDEDTVRVRGQNDSYRAAFILKWLTPHSVPSA